LRQRKRTALSAREGSSWLGPKGKPPNAYGLWRLDDTHETGELLIVEGETDTLTAWLHAVPCLGLPGADMAHCLEPEAVTGLDRVWIIEEPGRGGLTFVSKVTARLAAIGFTGSVRVISFAPVKDLNDLHLADPAGFAKALVRAQQASRAPGESSADPEGGAGASEDRLTLGRRLLRDGEEWLGMTFPSEPPLARGFLPGRGSLLLVGSPHSFKSMFALVVAVGLALGRRIGGRFEVPTPRRIFYVSEDDDEQRLAARLRAIVRGYGLDPDAETVRTHLATTFRMSPRGTKFNLDTTERWAVLEAMIAEHKPELLIYDPFRRIRLAPITEQKVLNEALARLEALQHDTGVRIWILHHYRRPTGGGGGRGRPSRGIQEAAGPFDLLASVDNQLAFDRISPTAIRVERDVKDLPPAVWLMRVPIDAHVDANTGEEIPDRIEVVLTDEQTARAERTAAAQEKKAQNRTLVLEAIKGLAPDPDPHYGFGVSAARIAAHFAHVAEKQRHAKPAMRERTVRVYLEALANEGHIRRSGEGRGQGATRPTLYSVAEPSDEDVGSHV